MTPIAVGLAILGAIGVVSASACGGDANNSAPTTPGTEERLPAPTSTPGPSGGGEFAGDWPSTDFSKRTVDLSEVIRGCPVRDCIPALDAAGATSIPSPRGGQATFAPVGSVDHAETLPVAYVTVGDAVRGYPLHILTWHEIVNDELAGTPIAVTFCPLCNTAITFDRRVAGQVLDFGVSGNLRHSDLIMWDRQTESWWQQATGEGIVGTHAGIQLEFVHTAVISFGDFVEHFPEADILTENTGFERDYGINPYEGYDSTGSLPFLFTGELDRRLDALERVVALRSGDERVAVPFSLLGEVRVANVTLGDDSFVVFWTAGTASALDRPDIAGSRDVGAAVAYVPAVDGQSFTFSAAQDGGFQDLETGSRWDITGRATAGPLAGAQLRTALHTTEFWFASAAFHPDTGIWQPR